MGSKSAVERRNDVLLTVGFMNKLKRHNEDFFNYRFMLTVSENDKRNI